MQYKSAIPIKKSGQAANEAPHCCCFAGTKILLFIFISSLLFFVEEGSDARFRFRDNLCSILLQIPPLGGG
jgi:hypothetical protein